MQAPVMFLEVLPPEIRRRPGPVHSRPWKADSDKKKRTHGRVAATGGPFIA